MSWTLKQTAAPAIEPIVLADAKTHLRVDTTADDALITALIVAAREVAEAYQRRALITQQFSLYIDQFPGVDSIWIPRPPLQAVASVKYTDNNGVTYVWDPSNYNVDTATQPGRVRLGWGKTWPVTTLQTVNAVEIDFTAGYGAAAANVPQSTIQAMLLLIGQWYENRSNVYMARTKIDALPLAVGPLLSMQRVFPFEPGDDD